MLWTTILSSAWAQATGVEGVNAQVYTPPIDSTHTLAAERSAVSDKGLRFRLFGQYLSRPLVYETFLGDELLMMESATEVDVVGSYSLGRFRLGALVPVFVTAEGQAVQSGSGLGDVAIDLKGSVFQAGGFGFALSARGVLPSATVDAPLGVDGPEWQAGAIADWSNDRLLASANFGYRAVPGVSLENVELGDQVVYRFGAGAEVVSDAGVSLDVLGSTNLVDVENRSSNVVEAMVGGFAGVSEDWVVRGGVGRGLTGGIGSPDLRVVAAMAFEPQGERDADLDGLVDEVDRCPDRPEDGDGFEDADGCPDPHTAVTLRFEDADGSAVDVVGFARSSEERFEVAGSSMVVRMHPGQLEVEVSADGFEGSSQHVVVPRGADHAVVSVMKRVPAPEAVAAPEPVVPPTIDVTVHFDVADAAVPKSSRAALAEVASMWSGVEGFRLRVEGHTDATGADAFNAELSKRRAEAVAAQLVAQGVPREHIEVVGFGPSRPVASNDSEQGRQQNRRVELVVVE